MATLHSFLSLGETSRTIRLTCFDYDVIVVVFDLSKFQNVRDTHDRVIYIRLARKHDYDSL